MPKHFGVCPSHTTRIHIMHHTPTPLPGVGTTPDNCVAQQQGTREISAPGIESEACRGSDYVDSPRHCFLRSSFTSANVKLQGGQQTRVLRSCSDGSKIITGFTPPRISLTKVTLVLAMLRSCNCVELALGRADLISKADPQTAKPSQVTML